MESFPYAEYVGTQDPIALLASTPERIARLVRDWSPQQWSRSYGEGKWSGAQLVLHLAQDEIGWSNRIRNALTKPDYVAQPFDGDEWVKLESPTEPRTVLEMYLAFRKMNLILYRKLTPEQRVRTLSHPEFGTLSVEWMLRNLAGHDLLHLSHLERIAVR